MNPFNAPTVLAAAALVILGGLAAAMMILPIPSANATSLTFILGALAGALTVSGGVKPAQSPAAPSLKGNRNGPPRRRDAVGRRR